jgi:hypothetical protein
VTRSDDALMELDVTVIVIDSFAPIRCSPLRSYAGCEELRGRLRAPVPISMLKSCSDRSGHDAGDEDIDR